MPDILLMEEVSEITRIPLPTLRFYRHAGLGPKSFKERPPIQKMDLQPEFARTAIIPQFVDG